MKAVIVHQAHVISDLIVENTSYRRAITDARDLLAIAYEACENGRQPVTLEYVDRAMAALGKAVGLAGIESSGPEPRPTLRPDGGLLGEYGVRP